MSYHLRLSKDKPKGLWMLNGSLTDLSGNQSAATVSGSAVSSFGPALVSGGLKSSIVSPSQGINFPSKVYKKGYERNAFTLEAWVFPNEDTASIMSRGTSKDGLYFEAGELKFSVQFASSKPTISYKPDTKKTMHVVGVYNRQSITLYVNGEIFEKLNFTSIEVLEQFTQESNSNLTAGVGGKVALNAVAIYEYALSENQIALHYKYGREAVIPSQVPAVYGGRALDISERASSIFLKENIGPSMSWILGDMGTLTVDSEGKLRQQFEAGSYLAGTWTYSFDTSFSPSVSAVRVGWEGEGNFTVSASLDLQNWTPVTNNLLIPQIVPGSSYSQVFVKVEFPVNDNGHLSSLELTGYSSDVIDIPNRGVSALRPCVNREEFSPLENRTDYGLAINGGSFYILPSTEEGFLGDYTWEFWYYSEDGSISFVSPNASVAYENGEAFVSIKAKSWTLIHLVSGGNPLSYAAITGQGIVGTAAVYPRVLTAEECKNQYLMYTGKIASRINGTGSVLLNTPQVKHYASDWAVVGSN